MSVVTIKETRNLLLPLDTVLEALLHFDRAAHGPLSRGEILQADFASGGPEGTGIDIAVRLQGDVVEWQRFNFTAIAAAIISYCRSKRIPLPYAGVKSLELTKDGIAFRIENTVSLAPAANVRSDLSGRPLRYAKGYEPHAIVPSSHHEALV